MSSDWPRLLLIAHRRQEEAVAEALAGGVRHLLLRDKLATDADLAASARRFQRMAVAHQAVLLIHNRVDLALTWPGVGVHLPENGVPTVVARQQLGRDRLLGRSCHTAAGVTQALAEGADYVTLSPLFPTRSHPEARPMGLELFATICRAQHGAILGLGGVNAHNAKTVLAAGGYGFALISAILDAPEPRQAAVKLVSIAHSGNQEIL